MKFMKKLALVPLEEWEKVKSYSNQKEMKIIKVPSLEKEEKRKTKKLKKKKRERTMEIKMNKSHSTEVKATSAQQAPAATAATTAEAAVTAAQAESMTKVSPAMKNQNQNQIQTQNRKKKKMKKNKFERDEKTPQAKQPLLRIEHFSPEKRKDASKILKFLTQSKKVGYNNKLELVFEKKAIPFSNVVQLIEHALDPKDTKKLKGLKRFYRILKKIKIPSSLVKNPLGLLIFNKKAEK